MDFGVVTGGAVLPLQQTMGSLPWNPQIVGGICLCVKSSIAEGQTSINLHSPVPPFFITQKSPKNEIVQCICTQKVMLILEFYLIFKPKQKILKSKFI